MSGLWPVEGGPCSRLEAAAAAVEADVARLAAAGAGHHGADRRGLLFALLGKDPVRGLQVFFVEPVKSLYALSELSIKATPLVLIALGLAVCFRSNVWNIGAEGSSWSARWPPAGWPCRPALAWPGWAAGIVVPILLAGVLGGMAWAGMVALLRDRFNANEILVSLMLVYVADMLLSYLVYGPWKDPKGYNFPQTITFDAVTKDAALVTHLRAVNIGVLIALVAVGGVVGVPVPHPRRLAAAGGRPGAGGGALRGLLVAQARCGGAAAVGRHGRPGRRAGGGRAAGPAHALCAGGLRLRRHHRGLRRPAAPGGHGVFSAVLMSMFYIGGELAQSRLGLPKSLTGVFQGLLLFTLLACDTLIHYRLRWAPGGPVHGILSPCCSPPR
jgi:ABC-type uncharacterized transport system permease subunit